MTKRIVLLFSFNLFFLFSATVLATEEAPLLAELERKLNRSNEEKVQLATEKAELEKQIVELQEKIKERKRLISLRLKAQSGLKRFQWGELLLNNNLNDLNRDLKILSNLNRYDFEIFKDYRATLQMLGESRKNLADTEKQIKTNVEIIKRQQNEFKVLESIRIDVLKKENISSFLLQKGNISRPLDGKLIEEFGALREQVRQYYLINYGELYSAPRRSPVKAVGPGVVIFRDLLSRWRETLIVQHNDNYYSVYAGVLPSNQIKIGERVNGGELLGSTLETEFYFELRHFANPINPKKWYKEHIQ
jgi:septal ring factor EnvC (AmiA/AmiB activator)